MRTKLSAVIAAGGNATRFGGAKPKSLIRANGITYLELLLSEVVSCGISEFLIYCNRHEFVEEIQSIARKYCAHAVFQDDGVLSTIEIARHAAQRCNSSQLLFLYGHSPQTRQHIQRIIDAPHLISVSCFNSSSKSKLIRNPYGGFIEPPYRIPTRLLSKSSYQEWRSFFESKIDELEFVRANSPPEFNVETERREVDRFLQTTAIRTALSENTPSNL